ncbi:MAG: hypothetical protein FWD61_02540 [Phycisphaerales bacterium]|nr:hypothetical protein [Phycisphaerales bacterium]
MLKSLEIKLAALAQHRFDKTFILADAKDADMAFGIASPGKDHTGKLRSLAEFREQIRQIVKQSLVDIMLMSASTSEQLTIRERLFDDSAVTPAVRANDTTDIHLARGSSYAAAPSRPFASTTIDHIQTGHFPSTISLPVPGANLGLYSVTFNNLPDYDLATLEAYKAFRLQAEGKRFAHFLEVFAPNVPASVHRIPPGDIPAFINDNIVRMLAGVPSASRPRFLKIPYLGPAAMEELCAYDTSILVGILGGSAGTTHDAFHLLHAAKTHGARVALFGRKINTAEDQLAFVEHLRLVADDQLSPLDAVKSYHAALKKRHILPKRKLKADLALTAGHSAYGKPRRKNKS